MRARVILAPILAAVALTASVGGAHASRLKDIGHFDGVRANFLSGFGVVVGLPGTGDSQRSAFTPQALESMLSRTSVRVDRSLLTLRNAAAVMVTAELPPFAQPGASIDVTVSSVGDARSLSGGTLLLTALSPGGGNKVFAFAQGPLKVGSSAHPGGASRSSGRDATNVGRIIGGARVELAVPIQLGEDGLLMFRINRPDFGTATNIAEAVNTAASTFGGGADTAQVIDAGTVSIQMPDAYTAGVASFIGEIERLPVVPDQIAKVVVNKQTGAVVMGSAVRLSEAAIAYEGLTLEIFNPEANAGPPKDTLKLVPEASTLADVVTGLNALGLTASELVDVLEAMAAAGAIQGRLEVQ
ncbi:MAG: flagellar biosynthesis protein FlgA [Proteobacteria bacterium]|nr:MAG: flagellar biosynthesis protein FlgA [Pseudomonadota bacterium]